MSSDKQIHNETAKRRIETMNEDEKAIEEYKERLDTDSEYAKLSYGLEVLNQHTYQLSHVIFWFKEVMASTIEHKEAFNDLEEKFEELCDEVDKLSNKFKWEIMANSKKYNKWD